MIAQNRASATPPGRGRAGFKSAQVLPRGVQPLLPERLRTHGSAVGAGGDRMLHIWASASRLQTGHTILSLELPLYLTHDHWDLG